ncbi:unnamed protein product [Phaedon cochleariae]|uniref:Uncharacterized protein n=1 Tax=Phaedon cochleariae TaxID=80249 RepID=A0A9P0GP75_PHACE|nr:unnamed protein product [Phaedon cochleariae]
MNLFLNISFANHTIERGWLSGCTRNVTQLKIRSSNGIFDIGDAAFAGQPFKALEYLIIEGNGISYLRKDTFFGATIVYLELRFDSHQYFRIESGVLNPLAMSLASFQLNNGICEPQAIRNLTGTGDNLLVKLQVVDLRYNILEVIANESFIDIPSLISLYLSDAGVKIIEERAFSGLGKSLQMLTIANNDIQTMDEGVFSGFDISGRIKIDGNPWRCNCTLEWMRHLYIEKLESYFDNGNELFLCHDHGTFRNYTDVIFCPSASTINTDTESITEPLTSTVTETVNTIQPATSTTSSTDSYKPITTDPSSETTSIVTNGTTIVTNGTTIVTHGTTIVTNGTTTTSSVTAVSTVQPSSSSSGSSTQPTSTVPSGKELSCEIFEQNQFPTWNSSHPSGIREADRDKIIYTFESMDDTPFYTVEIKNALPNGVLLWIDSQRQEKYGCISDITDKIELDVLEYTQSYFLCLLNDSEGKVNPFDCTTLVVPPRWGARTWIPNDFKYATIGGTLAVILAVILLTVVAVVLTLEKKPRLIREYRKYMPNQNFLVKKSTAPSLYSMSDGYLIANMYETINNLEQVGNYDSLNYELPPLPPYRSRDFTREEKWITSECLVTPRRTNSLKSVSRRDGSSRNKHPYSHYSRSKSIPGERICPVFVF